MTQNPHEEQIPSYESDSLSQNGNDEFKLQAKELVYSEVFYQKLLLTTFTKWKNFLRKSRKKTFQVNLWREAKSHLKLRKIFEVFKSLSEYRQQQQLNELKAVDFHQIKTYKAFFLVCRNQLQKISLIHSILRLKRLNLRKLLLQHYLKDFLLYHSKGNSDENSQLSLTDTALNQRSIQGQNQKIVDIKYSQNKMVELYRKMMLLKRAMRALKKK